MRPPSRALESIWIFTSSRGHGRRSQACGRNGLEGEATVEGGRKGLNPSRGFWEQALWGNEGPGHLLHSPHVSNSHPYCPHKLWRHSPVGSGLPRLERLWMWISCGCLRWSRGGGGGGPAPAAQPSTSRKRLPKLILMTKFIFLFKNERESCPRFYF